MSIEKELDALYNLKTKDRNYYSSKPLESEKDFNILRQALEDLEIYKKAFEDTVFHISNYEPNKYSINGEGFEYHFSKEEIKKMFLDQARKELSNERH